MKDEKEISEDDRVPTENIWGFFKKHKYIVTPVVILILFFVLEIYGIDFLTDNFSMFRYIAF